jgi:hypothetical protein
MLIALSSAIALLVAALNLKTDSAILLHEQKDWPNLGERFKWLGYFFVALAIVFFTVGIGFHYCPSEYVNPSVYLSLSVTLVILGALIGIKGIRLGQNQPKKFGRLLNYCVCIMIVVAVGLIVWTLVRTPISF